MDFACPISIESCIFIFFPRSLNYYFLYHPSSLYGVFGWPTDYQTSRKIIKLLKLYRLKIWNYTETKTQKLALESSLLRIAFFPFELCSTSPKLTECWRLADKFERLLTLFLITFSLILYKIMIFLLSLSCYSSPNDKNYNQVFGG